MKIRHLFVILFLALIVSVEAMAKTETFHLSMGPARLISFELVRAKNPKFPTFLFMPGVNRGLLANDEALETLASLGFGIAAMNFSTQPISVSELPKGVKPHFRTTTYKLDDLGTEVSALSNELKKNFNIKTIIPVSLSFSSAVSSSLKNFPFIIDTVPMTASAAVNPDLESYITYLKSAEMFNPIFGPGITRSTLDQAYAKEWTEQVDSIVEEFNLNKDRKADMIEGYSVFSRASERFVWDIKKTARETRRVFILAKDDSPILLKNQLEVLLKMIEENPATLAFIVKDAGHLVFSDQPESFASILSYLLTPESQDVSGVFEVKARGEKKVLHTGAQAQIYIKDLINTL